MGAEAGAVPRRGRWRGWWWKLPLLFAGFSMLQVLVLRFVDPPFSAFMAARQLDALVAGDTGLPHRHDWRDFERISPNLPLALVASEDQNFGNHHGFDFAAIEKAQAHNEKMVARAEKRGTAGASRLRGASTISQQTAKNLFLWQGSGPDPLAAQGPGGLVHRVDRGAVAEDGGSWRSTRTSPSSVTASTAGRPRRAASSARTRRS
jgi:monofunctional biosynthetic peptidoglycan transglycosylase